MSDLAVGDFDATGQADIFYADGETWWVAYDNAPFVPTQTSGFRVKDLRFGDFNADKRTDVFGVVSNAWRVSYSAESSWMFLRSKLTDKVDTLRVADFDGNGIDDIATYTVQVVNPTTTPVAVMSWKISRDGTGGWKTLLKPTSLPFAGIGNFVADDPRAGLLIWSENTWLRVNFGESSKPRHARQHMR